MPKEEPETTGSAPFVRSSVRQAVGAVPIPSYTPAANEAAELIERAKAHPLGLEYLLKGALDAVAATFSVHAFVVDHARSMLPTGVEGGGGFDRGEASIRTRNRVVKN